MNCAIEWAFLRLSQIVVALTVIGCLIAAWRHKRPMATKCGRFPL